MRLRFLPLILIPVLAVSVVALAWPDEDEDEHEERIELKDAPEAVQAAIKGLTSTESITGIEKETEDGLTVYEVAFKKDGREHEVTMAASGDIIEIEKSIDAAKLPKAARTAVEKKLPGGRIAAAKACTIHYFEVTVASKGEKRTFKVIASGEVKGDDDGDDDDDGDEGDDGDDDDDDHDGDDDD